VIGCHNTDRYSYFKISGYGWDQTWDLLNSRLVVSVVQGEE